MQTLHALEYLHYYTVIVDCIHYVTEILHRGRNHRQHSDLDYRIVSKKDFQTSFLGQEHLQGVS